MYPERSESSVPLRRVLSAGIILLACAFAAGFFFGSSRGTASTGRVLGSTPPAGVDFSPVWKAWSVIDSKFVPAAVATSTRMASSTEQMDQERVWGMISGLAASLQDPYTYFLPPQENEMFSADMSGEFEGVGMEIAIKDEILTVVSPLKNTPAQRAGIKAGDRILKIDDTETQGMDVTQAVQKIRGPKGTQVALLIVREGESSPREIKVTRDVINVPIVTTKETSSENPQIPDDVFVIQLATFTSSSPDLFRASLREFVVSGKQKLILDLRGNPGGYLDAAVDMASWFLPTGAVVVTEDYAGHSSNVVHRSAGYNVFNKNLKMVILVDKGSASASEILADALRHYGVAKLVGVNTFGKGSVQELVDITPETALKITVARWLGPDKKQIPRTGIAPDYKVDITEEDIKEKRDPQMDKAVEVLSEM